MNLKTIPLKKRLLPQLRQLRIAEETEEEKEINIELVNSNLKDAINSDYIFFMDLVNASEELGEQDFNKAFLKKLSEEDELLSKFIGNTDDPETFKKQKNLDLIKKGENLLGSKGEIGRVYKFLDQLETSKVQKTLKNNMSKMYKLLYTGDYEEFFDKLSESSAKMYALWKNMSQSQKQAVIDKSKDILEDMLLRMNKEEGSVGESFSSSLGSQVKSNKWKGFFRTLFYEGLFEPFYSTITGKSIPISATLSKGSRVIVASKDNILYGLIGKVVKIGNNVVTLKFNSDRETTVPIDEIKKY